ncbi:MAG: hypothetical protein WC472_01500 [Candidatus Paceibacterota bacterium]
MLELPFTLYDGKVVGVFKENKETGYHAYFLTDQERGIINKRAKGTTTIIGIKDKSPQLVSWATGLAEDYLMDILLKGEQIAADDILTACNLHSVKKQEAADIGTEIHEWAEQYIKWSLGIKGFNKPSIPKKKEVKLGVRSFLKWVNDHNVKFISSERVVYSRKYGFIGTMDIEAIIDGKLALTDLKSSSGLYNTVRMQTSAYAKADMENDPSKKYETRWAIRLTKETESEYYERMNKKKMKSKDPETYEIPEYVIFEAKEFPDKMEEDYQAFLNAKGLYDWDDETDFYKIAQKEKAELKKQAKENALV